MKIKLSDKVSLDIADGLEPEEFLTVSDAVRGFMVKYGGKQAREGHKSTEKAASEVESAKKSDPRSMFMEKLGQSLSRYVRNRLRDSPQMPADELVREIMGKGIHESWTGSVVKVVYNESRYFSKMAQLEKIKMEG